MTIPTFSPYGGFSEGDHVTRDGSDVHLVKDMTGDGFAATFVCVVAPAGRWIEVGEEESNVCRRYTRLKFDEATQQWVDDLDAKQAINTWVVEPYSIGDSFRIHFDRTFKTFIDKIAHDLARAIGLKFIRESRSAHYRRQLHRRPKRRALRK
jgi:hypothetical protein